MWAFLQISSKSSENNMYLNLFIKNLNKTVGGFKFTNIKNKYTIMKLYFQFIWSKQGDSQMKGLRLECYQGEIIYLTPLKPIIWGIKKNTIQCFDS